MLLDRALEGYLQSRLERDLKSFDAEEMPNSNDLVVVRKLQRKFLIAAYKMSEVEVDILTRHFCEMIVGVEWLSPGFVYQIGKKLNSVGDKPPLNIKSFWQSVIAEIPGLISAEERNWLSQNDEYAIGAFELLYLLYQNGKGTYLRSIMHSIHSWK